MRIAFLTVGDIRVTATAKRAFGMAQPLARRGHHVGIVAWDTPANRARLAVECPGADALWVHPAASVQSEWRARARHLSAWNPDLVYVCAAGLRNWIGWRRLGRRVRVVVEHSELRSAIPAARHRRLWEILVEYASIVGADGLLCASRYLQRVYVRRAGQAGRPRLPIAYHPYAYTPGPVPDQETVAALRAEGDGRRIILYMGTLVANYGIFEIIEAAGHLIRQRRNFVLHVLGHGRHAEQARQHVAQAGLDDTIRFHGYAAEESLSAWFAAADVFLAPIHSTVQDLARCPSKLYMYLPAQRPIVTSRLGDPGDLLQDDGFYHEPGDAADMAATMGRALDAAPSWRPSVVDPAHHTWEFRTGEFLSWCASQGWLDSPDTQSRVGGS